jgi:hypothetical protein
MVHSNERVARKAAAGDIDELIELFKQPDGCWIAGADTTTPV